MTDVSKTDLFEHTPVPAAVRSLAIPTVLSQLVTIFYNLGDTFFIGRTGDPYMVAAVSLVYPWFHLLAALSNMFGVGGGSLISRLMGKGRATEAASVSSLCFYSSLVTALFFSLATYIFRRQILSLLGASSNTCEYALSYMLWVVVAGSAPTMLSMATSYFLRSEGHTVIASIGMTIGGILNLILDPLLIFGLNLGIAGAAIATVMSNCVSLIYLLFGLHRLGRNSVLSIRPKYMKLLYLPDVLSVGVASAMSTGLASISNIVIIHLAAAYGDIAVAAFGIVKKIDMFPLGVNMGLCQGVMPLIGYNYASGNRARMCQTARYSWTLGVGIAAGFTLLYLLLAPEIIQLFIIEPQTVRRGTEFLRIACLSVPLSAINFLISYTLQSMGKGAQSALLTACRQGIINIPLLFIMNKILGMYGIIWTQCVADALTLFISSAIYRTTMRREMQSLP